MNVFNFVCRVVASSETTIFVVLSVATLKFSCTPGIKSAGELLSRSTFSTLFKLTSRSAADLS